MAAIEFAWMTYWPQLLVSERVHVTKCTGVCQKRACAAWEKNSGKSCGFMICDLACVRDTMSMILRFFPHPSASCQRVCKSKGSKGFLQTAACSGEASDWEGTQTRIVAAAFEAETTGTYCNLHFFTSLRSECPSPVFLLSSMWLQVPSGPPLHLAVQLLSQTLWRHGGLSMTFVSRFSHRIYNFQGPLAHRLAVGWKSTMFHRIPSDSIGFHRITVSTVWIAFTTNLSSDDDPGSGCYDTPPWLFNLMITDRCCWNRLFNDLATLDAHTGYPYADGKLGTGICGTCWPKKTSCCDVAMGCWWLFVG